MAYLAFYGMLWPSAPFQTNDTGTYARIAETIDNGSLNTMPERSIGYPFLLLLTNSISSPTRSLFYSQLCMHMLAMIAAAYTISKMEVPIKWIMIFITVGILPLWVEPAAFALTETPTAFSLVIGFSCLMLYFHNGKLGLLLLGCIFLCLSALLRPTYQILSIVIAIVFLIIKNLFGSELLYSRLNRSAGALILTSFVVLGGFSLSNWIKFEYFGLSPQIGANLSVKTVTFYERLPEEFKIEREILIKHRNTQLIKPFSSHTGSQTIFSAWRDLKAATGLNDFKLYRHLLRINFELIKSAPALYALDVFRSMPSYWFPYTKHSNLESRELQAAWAVIHTVNILSFFLLCLLTGAMVFFIFFFKLHKRPLESFFDKNQMLKPDFLNPDRLKIVMLFLSTLFVIIVYSFLITVAFDVGNQRQRTPTDILILLFNFVAGYTLIELRKRI
jgi:hypothetical protein